MNENIKIFEYFYKMCEIMSYNGKNSPIMLAFLDNSWSFVINESNKNKLTILAVGSTIEDLVKNFYKKYPDGYK